MIQDPEDSFTRYPRFIPSDNVKKYTIRVSLKGVTPSVWRKFECPSNISLRHLTELCIDLMGWYNMHLNKIQVGQNYYVPAHQYDSEYDWMGCYHIQDHYKLSDVLCEKGKTIRWEYDFGDSWIHEIRLSSVEDYEEYESHDIVFKSGKNACPPEDCGGVPGYMELLRILDKHKAGKRLTKDEREFLDWADWDKNTDTGYFDEYECIDNCDYYSGDDEEEEVSMPKAAELKTTPLYDEVLSLAFRIRQLEPWEDLDDSDVYAIRMQDGSEIYIATMGYAGESYDVQLFDGQDGFQFYLAMVKGDSLREYELADAAGWSNYMSIMYQEPADQVLKPLEYRQLESWAQAHDVQIEKAHGYPFVQSFTAHRFPSMLVNDEQKLTRIKEALQAIEWFSQLIMDTDDLTQLGFKSRQEYPSDKGGKVVPLIVHTEQGYQVERTKLPGHINTYETVVLPESDLQPLRFLQKSGTQLCRLLHLPGFIGSEDDTENAYIGLVLICVDKKTDKPSMTEACDWSDNYVQDVLHQFVEKIMEDGTLPQRIVVDDARTEAFLKDFCQRLGIILEFKRTRIPILASLCGYLYTMGAE